MKICRGIFTESIEISRSKPLLSSSCTACLELNATPIPEITAALSPTRVPTSSATDSGPNGVPMFAKWSSTTARVPDPASRSTRVSLATSDALSGSGGSPPQAEDATRMISSSAKSSKWRPG